MKKYNNEQLRQLLEKAIITSRTHKHYKRTCELAEYYRKIVTGEDQGELVVSYKPRETAAQKEQRIAITNTRTQYVSNKVLSVFKRVPRSDNVVDNIYYEDEAKDNNDKIAEIQKRFENFHNGESMKDWLTEAFEHWEFMDPNAWLVVEFRNVDKEKPFIYPVEVPSKQAIDYEWYHGELQYLMIKQSSEIWEKEKNKSHNVPDDIKRTVEKIIKGVTRKGDKYLLYAADYALEYVELAAPDKIMPEEAVLYAGYQLVQLQVGNVKKRFAVKEYDTKSKICPAKQFGYIKDPETARETFVSPLHPADKIYRDLINTKSEFDLAKALHGFLQKIQYAKACDYEGEFEGNQDRCLNGKLAVSQKVCPSCNGVGLKIHKTTQDVILVQWPDGKEEHIPLDQAVHYVEVPEHIIKMWKTEVQDLEKDVSFAIFNTNLFDRTEIVFKETATAKTLDAERANDVLFDYGSQMSAFVKFITMIAAIHTRNDDKIVIDHKISSFNLETTFDLLTQRRLAVEAGSPYTIIQGIDMRIMQKQSQDAPENIEWIRVREKFRPFREKSKEEKMFILADLGADDPKKVLYIHFEDIMDMIEFKFPSFAQMTLDVQKKVVDVFIAQMIIQKNNGESFRESLDPNDPQARLRGSVGGVTGLVQVAQAVANGEMTEGAAETILKEIYGLDPAIAAKMIEVPPVKERAKEAAAAKGEQVTDPADATV